MWRYNEVIGSIRLRFFGSQILGESYSVKRRRIVRTRSKVLEYRTHKLAPEINMPADATGDCLLRLVKCYLRDCERELPRRHIDTGLLDTIGPFINGRKLYLDQLRGSMWPKPRG